MTELHGYKEHITKRSKQPRGHTVIVRVHGIRKHLAAGKRVFPQCIVLSSSGRCRDGYDKLQRVPGLIRRRYGECVWMWGEGLRVCVFEGVLESVSA